MPDYKNGKIYAIKSYQTNLCYIGATTQILSKRLGEHRLNYKKDGCIKSKELIKYDDHYIELLEEYPCNNKMELNKREGYYILENINNCVNCNIAGRTAKEYRDTHKKEIKIKTNEYYKKNKEKILEQKKKYKENNKEKIAEYKKEYRQKNKKKIKEYETQNKEKILERKKKYRENKKLNNINEIFDNNMKI